MQVKQAANVIELLEFFADRSAPATLAEVADGMEWPRSSTFNLVGTLLEKGYLYEPGQRGAFYPSLRWNAVADRLGRSDGLPDVLRDMVDEIGRRTDETTALGAASGRFVMFLHVHESRQPIRYFAEVGTRAPIHATSAGRALIAQMEPKEREALYRRIVFKPLTAHTPMSVARIESDLRDALARGYHQSHSEEIEDLVGVSFPVPWGERRFSVVTAGPVSRCLERRPEIARIMAESMRRRGLATNLRPAGAAVEGTAGS